MTNLLLLLAIMIAGAATTVQSPINASLAEKVGIIHSATISFLVGTLVLLAVSLSIGRGSFRAIATVELWQLTGGLFGAFFVAMTIFAVPRLGVGAVMAALIVAQLTTGILLDHLGLFGLRQIPCDFSRVAGVLLMLVGVMLVFRR